MRSVKEEIKSLEIKKSKQIDKSLIDMWEESGAPCVYAKFQSPVRTSSGKEPVTEFNLEKRGNSQTSLKYIVDSMVYSEGGLIWRANGERHITGLANITEARLK